MAENFNSLDFKRNILLIEPFYGGSHKELMDILCKEFPCDLFHQTAKKWHWRARTSALYFSFIVPREKNYKVLFCSSVLNLSELIALRNDLSSLKKIIYFHENQLIYPVRKSKDRDFQYGYNQILSCLVADFILFNSKFNQDSFLLNVNSFLKLMPDYKIKEDISKIIAPKCKVVYFPLICLQKAIFLHSNYLKNQKLENRLENITGSNIYSSEENQNCLVNKNNDCMDNESKLSLSNINNKSDNIIDASIDPQSSYNTFKKEKNIVDYLEISNENFLNEKNNLPLNDCSLNKNNKALCIVWPHRWEHDKNPDVFFQTLFKLSEEGLEFYINIVGQTFEESMDIFMAAKVKLSKHIKNWGFVENKDDYYKVLKQSDVVVSTAIHEFFGVAV